MILPMEGDETSGWKPEEPSGSVMEAYAQHHPTFSPDGRWLAYQSNETGRFEVYVRPFPGPGAKRQISNDGGAHPTWSRARPELFYNASQRIMLVPYTAKADSFVAENPRLWSEGRFRRSAALQYRPFDLHPDGQRFALALPTETESARQDKIVLIFNFFDELRRIAPAGE